MYFLRALKVWMFCMALAPAFMCEEAAAQFPTQTVTASSYASASSWLAGAHAGYNWHQGTLLYGIETDFQATHLNSPAVGILQYNPPPAQPGDFAAALASIDWYGTLRGRLGMTMGSLLLYVTGGVAYGVVELSSTFSAFGGVSTFAQNTTPKIGGVVGAGAEYLLKPNLMLTFQYQYVDLGRVDVASSTTAGCCTAIAQSATVRAQFQAAMVGLSWRFAPDGSGSPWAGGYAGGHVGGAWGNNTSGRYNGLSEEIIE